MNSHLGIQRIDHVDFVVADLERSTRFYRDQMGMSLTQDATDHHIATTGEHSRFFEAGRARMKITAAAEDETSHAGKFLRRHPDGIRTVAFRVDDVDHAFKLIDERGGAIIDEPQGDENYRSFHVASPLGDVEYAFVQRKDDGTQQGLAATGAVATENNPHGFTHMDHITSNTRDMRSLTNWYRDVLGFEHFWDIRFHTKDANPDSTGSGLQSIVMRDPKSNVKFATNEPLRPDFANSQIQKFVEDNCGPGVQHIALSTAKIMDVIPNMKATGLKFLETPDAYYDMLPSRMAERAVENLKETLEDLQERKILVDGRDNRYLLQIFMQEASLLYDQQAAGPFFFEVIQRCGEQGFGEGNFRALFESIERQQTALDKGRQAVTQATTA